jgi:hypothetical protein
MLRSAAIALALVLGSNVTTWAQSPPPAATSEFLHTVSAGFTLNDSVGVVYAVTCSVRVEIGIPIYVTGQFENPSNRKSPLTVQQILPARQLELTMGSPAFRRIKNAQIYKIEIFLYKDEGRSQLIGKHLQKVYFGIPEKLAEVLGIELL